MRQETELRQSLRDSTALVVEASRGSVAMGEFVEKYGNFYYYGALDGHEADESGRALLQRYSALVQAHEQVQTAVVDIVYLGPCEQRAQYLRAGRITAEEAKNRLDGIVKKYRLEERLRSPELGEDA